MLLLHHRSLIEKAGSTTNSKVVFGESEDS